MILPQGAAGDIFHQHRGAPEGGRAAAAGARTYGDALQRGGKFSRKAGRGQHGQPVIRGNAHDGAEHFRREKMRLSAQDIHDVGHGRIGGKRAEHLTLKVLDQPGVGNVGDDDDKLFQISGLAVHDRRDVGRHPDLHSRFALQGNVLRKGDAAVQGVLDVFRKISVLEPSAEQLGQRKARSAIRPCIKHVMECRVTVDHLAVCVGDDHATIGLLGHGGERREALVVRRSVQHRTHEGDVAGLPLVLGAGDGDDALDP